MSEIMKMAKMSDGDLVELRKRAKRDKTGMLGHLLDCYQTAFDNACDPTQDVLEFKPEIKNAQARIEFLEYELGKRIIQSSINRLDCLKCFVSVEGYPNWFQGGVDFLDEHLEKHFSK